MLPPTSQILAQALSAAIALAYGLALAGLWLQFRRAPMLAFARVFLMLGATSAAATLLAMSVQGLLFPKDAEAWMRVLALVTALTCGVTIMDAVLVTAARPQHRRALWVSSAILGLLIVAGSSVTGSWLSGVFPGSGTRAVLSGMVLSGMIVLWRSAHFPGRLLLGVALGFLLVRFSSGIAVGVLIPAEIRIDAQPVWFTILQLLCMMLAGFYATVALFALERDATVRERVQLERQLAQAQRIESLGRMAASVAHDFNNVLAAVLGATELASDPGASPTEQRASIAEIRDSVEVGRRLTQQFTKFARPSDSDITDFSPLDSLRGLLPMLQRVAGPAVEIRLDILVAGITDALTLRADRAQFEQLFLNLTANARDAMPGGGTLSIHCSLVEERRTSPRASTLKKGSVLTITVTDTGGGIPLDVIEHVFEPFFTTKSAAGGSGLGLATAFATVQHAGGLLTVASREGVGTTFTIRLPVTAPGSRL